jgi:microcystin-dependent protein
MAVVIAVGAMLLGGLVPNYLKGLRLEAARRTALEMAQIAEVSRAYYIEKNSWPSSLQQMSDDGFLDPRWKGSNAFGKPYVLELSDPGLIISAEVPIDLAGVVAGLLPMSSFEAGVVRSQVTAPGVQIPGIPVGSIISWTSLDLPDGWLWCDGHFVSRQEQAELFKVIGITFGAGDGTTTFALPDLRGRTLVGLDNMGGSVANVISAGWAQKVGGKAGTESHRLTVEEMPAHTHSYGYATVGGRYDGHSSPLYNYTVSAQSGSSGGDLPHNNIQPSMAVGWIIKS